MRCSVDRDRPIPTRRVSFEVALFGRPEQENTRIAQFRNRSRPRSGLHCTFKTRERGASKYLANASVYESSLNNQSTDVSNA